MQSVVVQFGTLYILCSYRCANSVQKILSLDVERKTHPQ